MTQFNTVVLFDVENLLGEPAGWKQAATELSFGDIIAQLRRNESGLIGEFAVSRAYANWGRPFMATLRREMTENGVEPRQIFAFDAAARKNAADIELVIDALDLAYSRSGITTFVVVTRDGGFSSLGRKLHELGKAVVVCADSQCSKALRAVADAFVELPAPDAGLLVVDDPIAADTVRSGDLDAEGKRALDDARASAIRAIKALESREGERFRNDGVLLASVGQVLASAAPLLAVARSAYPGLREFLQWALANTPYCVFVVSNAPEGSRHRLGLRAGRAAEEVLPAFERRPPRVTDPVDQYRLLASQGQPSLRLPRPTATAQVLRAVAKRGVRDEDLASVIEDIADTLAGAVPAEHVRFTVLALALSNAMSGEPTTVPMSARRYTLMSESRTFPQLRAALLSTVRDKLARLTAVDDAVLQRLVSS